MKKADWVWFPQGAGEYEYPNPAGGGVFCLQRHIISAMCRQTPGEVYELFKAVLSRPLVRQTLEEAHMVSWTCVCEREDAGAMALRQTIRAWADGFTWRETPRWFLVHTVHALVDLVRDPDCDQQLVKWGEIDHARRVKDMPSERVRFRSALLPPELLQHWVLGLPARYTTHELPRPPFPGQPWNPLTETAQQYREDLKQPLGKDYKLRQKAINAYINAGKTAMEALELDVAKFGQHRLNPLTSSAAHLILPLFQFRVANFLALRVFGKLSYGLIAIHDQAEREAEAHQQRSEGIEVRRQRIAAPKTIKNQVQILAGQTKIELCLGRPMGYRQSQQPQAQSR